MTDAYGRPLLQSQQVGSSNPPPQATGGGGQQQQQQQSSPQQQQQQQSGPTTPTNTTNTNQEQPGFFKRLFGGSGNANGSSPSSPPAAPVSVPEEAQTANCLPSKALPADEASQIRNRQLPASKFSCLNGAATATAPGAPGATGTPGAPGTDPNAAQFPPPPLTTPGLTGPPPEVSRYGPYLRFGGYDPVSRMWNASVLVVVHQGKTTMPPRLMFRDVDLPGGEASVTAIHLDHYQGWNFWRFNLVVECGLKERCVEYSIHLSTDHAFTHQQRHRVLVPGIAQKWRWGFYSCNGFHEDHVGEKVGGIQPLWRDVMFCHTKAPFHVMIGGGDQLYNDHVWQVPSLVEWCRVQDQNARIAHPFTQDMVNQVFDFFFNAYIHHWNEDLFREALASIPMLMTWDDHDIFDGWGSYPDYLQACPVFQGIYFIARKFYALFQQHTTTERVATDNNVFGEFAWHQLTCFGATTAVLVLDTRSERTLKQIVRPMSWAMIQDRLARLPPTVRHVVVIAAVPVIYPKIPVAESALQWMQGDGRSRNGVVKMLQKTGLADSLMTQFGTIDILDDLLDHWGAEVHEAEKKGLVHMMQAISLARGFRFTLISGDVHVAAMGRFCSHPHKSLKHDHRYIPQIISSAIGNEPPPPAVVKALTAANKKQMLDHHTKESMSAIFGPKKIICDARNWLVGTEKPHSPGNPQADGSLVFQFRVEPEYGLPDMRPVTYEVTVPLLELHHLHALPLPSSPLTIAAPIPQGMPQPNHPNAPPGAQVPPSPFAGIHGTISAIGRPPQGAQGSSAGYPSSGPMPGPGQSSQGVMPHQGPPPGTPAWLLNQSSTPGTFPLQQGPYGQQQQQQQQQQPPPQGSYGQQPPPPQGPLASAAYGQQQQSGGPPQQGGPSGGYNGYNNPPAPQSGGYNAYPQVPPPQGGYPQQQQQQQQPQQGGYNQPPSYGQAPPQPQQQQGAYGLPQQHQPYGGYSQTPSTPPQQQQGGYGNTPPPQQQQQQYYGQAPTPQQQSGGYMNGPPPPQQNSAGYGYPNQPPPQGFTPQYQPSGPQQQQQQPPQQQQQQQQYAAGTHPQRTPLPVR